MRTSLVALLLAGCSSAPLLPPPADPVAAPDGSWPAPPIRAPEYAVMERKSFYVPMRDGVKIAVDVWLPVGLPAEAKLPTILEQTRYYRSALVKSDPNGACRPPAKATIELFVRHGYAYVLVDTRGSGASFGTRVAEYSEDEIEDGAQIVDWILRQPWADGKVGALGQSYTGTTAELLLRNHHPAVTAVLPTFSGYEFYDEIVFPGGIRSTFAQYWSDLISGLDRVRTGDASPILGPCPVDEDTDRSQLRAAIAQHAGNLNVGGQAAHVSFSDDVLSLKPFQREIDAANRPLYGITGWFDSGYTRGALRRFQNSTSAKKRLLIGPWNHGARFAYVPGVRAATPSAFDLASEKLRYFETQLKGIDAGFEASPPIRYFTTGANLWQSTDRWPPAASHPATWHFDTDGTLVGKGGPWSGKSGPKSGADEFTGDGSADSGAGNRWRATMGPLPVFYPDRAAADQKLLTYTSAPLPADVEVTGDPIAHVFLSTRDADADVIVYLEEVTAGGEVNYVGEGELRASHRDGHRKADARPVTPEEPMELKIELLPLSHRFKAGNRIRVTLADSDRAQFVESPPRASHWRVLRGGATASKIELPVVDRSVPAG